MKTNPQVPWRHKAPGGSWLECPESHGCECTAREGPYGWDHEFFCTQVTPGHWSEEPSHTHEEKAFQCFYCHTITDDHICACPVKLGQRIDNHFRIIKDEQERLDALEGWLERLEAGIQKEVTGFPFGGYKSPSPSPETSEKGHAEHRTTDDEEWKPCLCGTRNDCTFFRYRWVKDPAPAAEAGERQPHADFCSLDIDHEGLCVASGSVSAGRFFNQPRDSAPAASCSTCGDRPWTHDCQVCGRKAPAASGERCAFDLGEGYTCGKEKGHSYHNFSGLVERRYWHRFVPPTPPKEKGFFAGHPDFKATPEAQAILDKLAFGQIVDGQTPPASPAPIRCTDPTEHDCVPELHPDRIASPAPSEKNVMYLEMAPPQGGTWPRLVECRRLDKTKCDHIHVPMTELAVAEALKKNLAHYKREHKRMADAYNKSEAEHDVAEARIRDLQEQVDRWYQRYDGVQSQAAKAEAAVWRVDKTIRDFVKAHENTGVERHSDWYIFLMDLQSALAPSPEGE
jgi:hypothetical protein